MQKRPWHHLPGAFCFINVPVDFIAGDNRYNRQIEE